MTTPDFSQLYAQLNLRPDCSLEEFKHAYRRRVAELHPDRRPPQREQDDQAGITLPELISLYGLAMQFQKQHGRLPGGPLPYMGLRPRNQPHAHGATSSQADRTGAGGFANVSSRSWALLLVLMLVAVYLVVSGMPAD